MPWVKKRCHLDEMIYSQEKESMMYRVIDLPDDEVDSWRSEWNRKVRVEERRFLYEVSEESVCLFVGY